MKRVIVVCKLVLTVSVKDPVDLVVIEFVKVSEVVSVLVVESLITLTLVDVVVVVVVVVEGLVFTIVLVAVVVIDVEVTRKVVENVKKVKDSVSVLLTKILVDVDVREVVVVVVMGGIVE